MATISEKLFRDYCSLHSLPVKHLDVSNELGRSPDYEVTTSYGKVICEIKQIEINEQEIEFHESLRKYGRASDQCTPGKRVHSALKDAAGQLRKYKHSGLPCVAILHDNRVFNGHRIGSMGDCLSPQDIDAGMFGAHIVMVHLSGSNQKPSPADWTHGGNRRLTIKQGLYISAVGVLHFQDEDKSILIHFYHNPFAKTKLLPNSFPYPDVTHFVKGGHPDQTGHGWIQYVWEN